MIMLGKWALALVGFSLLFFSGLNSVLFFAAYYCLGIVLGGYVYGWKWKLVGFFVYFGLFWLVFAAMAALLCWVRPYRNKSFAQMMREDAW